MCVIVKTTCFCSFTKTFSKLSLKCLPRKTRNLSSFYGGLFELEILELFTAAFLLKTIIIELEFFSQYCRVLSLKNKEILKSKSFNLKIDWLTEQETEEKH